MGQPVSAYCDHALHLWNAVRAVAVPLDLQSFVIPFSKPVIKSICCNKTNQQTKRKLQHLPHPLCCISNCIGGQVLISSTDAIFTALSATTFAISKLLYEPGFKE
jgi:hypothetical protein